MARRLLIAFAISLTLPGLAAAQAPDATPSPGGTATSGKPDDKAQQPDPPKDGFTVGGFTFRPGGRVKVDFVRDFKPVGNEEAFDVRTIPVDGSEGTNSNVNAKETRLTLDIRGPVEGRELRMFVETDFYGTGGALRLRHAFGSYGGLTAGQTWSTFVDDENLPSTIDFETPVAFALVRQAQVRWTQKLSNAVTWSAAIEDNKSTITVPSTPGKAEYPMPDVVTRFRFAVPRGHVKTAAFVGAARYRPTTGSADTVTLWGASLSARFNTWDRDAVYAVFTTGAGIGRYRGGTTAVPDANGQLHAVAGNAYMAGYERNWNARWSTHAVFSITDTTDEPFYTSSMNKQLTYGAVNLLYWFLPGRAWTGVEYLYGERHVFGSGDPQGSAHRVIYAVRFNLP